MANSLLVLLLCVFHGKIATENQGKVTYILPVNLLYKTISKKQKV